MLCDDVNQVFETKNKVKNNNNSYSNSNSNSKQQVAMARELYLKVNSEVMNRITNSLNKFKSLRYRRKNAIELDIEIYIFETLKRKKIK